MPKSKTKRAESQQRRKEMIVPTKIVLVNQRYWLDAQAKFLAAAVKVSPYRVTADGDRILIPLHPSNALPFVRPNMKISKHSNGCMLESISFVQSAEPFPDILAKGFDEETQRARSAEIYRLDQAAVDLFMRNFTIAKAGRSLVRPNDVEKPAPAVTMTLEADGEAVLSLTDDGEAVDFEKSGPIAGVIEHDPNEFAAAAPALAGE